MQIKVQRSCYNIDFPLNLFKNRKVNFLKFKERKRLFRRNIYHKIYKKELNLILESRSKIIYDLANKVKKILNEKNKDLKIISISLFGSSLYSKKPEDFDFLVIVEGNYFDNKTKMKIIYFYDWFGNKLMRARDDIPLDYNYRTMEEWTKLLKKLNFEELKSEFISEIRGKPDLFPPKAILVFKKIS